MLTIAAEVDGRTRLPRMATEVAATDGVEDSPVVVIRGANHSTFADGAQLSNDLPPERPLEVMQRELAQLTVGFIARHRSVGADDATSPPGRVTSVVTVHSLLTEQDHTGDQPTTPVSAIQNACKMIEPSLVVAAAGLTVVGSGLTCAEANGGVFDRALGEQTPEARTRYLAAGAALTQAADVEGDAQRFHDARLQRSAVAAGAATMTATVHRPAGGEKVWCTLLPHGRATELRCWTCCPASRADPARSDDAVAVHLAQRVADQLDPLPVRTAEVQRRPRVVGVGDAGVVELRLQRRPAGRLHGDGDVVQAACHLGVAVEIQTGEVEERQRVAEADVEEEVRRAGVVAVGDQLGQRELQEVLVEGDRPLDVGGDQCRVVQTTGRGGGPLGGRAQVRGPQIGPLLLTVHRGCSPLHDLRTDPLAHQLHDLSRLRVPPGGLLGVDQLAVHDDLEGARAARDEPEVAEDRRPAAEDLVRQTDGTGDVVSGDAELDGDVVLGVEHCRSVPSAPMAPRNPLIAALDTASPEELRGWAAAIGPHVGTVKIGLQAYIAMGPGIVRDIAAEHPVFLDLKLHDIPNTVAGAAAAVADLGVRMLTVHASGGPAMIAAAAEAIPGVAVLAVTVLTSLSEEDLAAVGQRPVAEQVPRLAVLAVEAGAGGIVCAPSDIAAVRGAIGPDPLVVVPGIRPAGAAHDDQARVATPAEAMAAGASHLVIGRPITRAADPAAAAAAILATL